MYYIVDESTNDILYAPNMQNELKYNLIDPTWTEEINKAGSLEFTMYPTHQLYDKYKKMTTIFAVKDENDKVVWRGRVLNDTKDFYNAKQVYCEGQLAFFNDSIIRPYNLKNYTLEKFFNYLLTEHNQQVESRKQFVVGSVDLGYKTNFVTEIYEYRSTLTEIQELLDTYGGYILFENDKIYYSSISGDISNQPIQFGVNMLDYTEAVEASDICTVLIPLGTKKENADGTMPEDPLTIKSVNGGKDYIENQNGIKAFGRIVQAVTFDDINVAQTLKTVGIQYLSKLFQQATSITVTAADLFDLGLDVDRIRCGNYHQIFSTPHGIDTYYQCTKVVHHLEDPMSSEYTFGTTLYSLSDKAAKDNKIMFKLTSALKINKVKTII